ncbi:hypothetical protein [Thiocystis violacea]|uniref:hypothetical protein n=1 Tax=Thiocystis violacea TaxID=13725 RepID=UPI00190398BC|nr:hypothetical protein [Thiocystis violacea]MBK1723451.1 hypothetical protein [Thiocystis violacea]
MKTQRLVTLLSVATMASALLLPTLASAHGRQDHGDQGKEARWASPPPKHAPWREDRHEKRHHHKHSKWDHRRDRRDARVRVYVADPRHPPHPRRPAPSKLHLGNGLTIIYR